MASFMKSSSTTIVSTKVQESSTWITPLGAAKSSTFSPVVDYSKQNVPPSGSVQGSQGLPALITPERLPITDPMKGISRAKNPIISRPKKEIQKENLKNGSILTSLNQAKGRTAATSRTVFRPLGPLMNFPSSEKKEFSGRPQPSQSPKKAHPPFRPFVDVACTNVHTKSGSASKALAMPRPSATNTSFQALDKIDELPAYGRKLRDIVSIGSIEAAHRAESMLRSMIKKCSAENMSFGVDGACFNAVIHAYAELGNTKAAEAVLKLMFHDYEHGNKNAEPNVRVFTNVLHAWRKSKSSDAPERCERILQNMHHLHETGKLPSCQPDTYAYTVLFHCWAECDRADAADQAERLFRSMKYRFVRGQKELRPDTIAYSNLLNIFVKKESTHKRAESLLWEMCADYFAGNDSAEPRIRNFNTCVAMWSKSKLHDAPDRAQSLVTRMIQLHQAKELRARPDSFTYSLLLKTWVTAKRPSGVTQAVKCLHWMKDMHKLGDHAARLDVIKYTTCISALSHKGHAQLAEDLLNEMRRDFLEGNAKAEPNAKLYEFVIGAWTGEGKGSKIDGYRAQELLHQMWAMHDNGSFRDIRPTIHTYSLVILAMTKTRHPDRANELLDQMERYYERGFIRTGGVNQKLHRQLYQTVIHSWEHSRLADRKKSAQQLSVKMFRRFGSKPHDH